MRPDLNLRYAKFQGHICRSLPFHAMGCSGYGVTPSTSLRTQECHEEIKYSEVKLENSVDSVEIPLVIFKVSGSSTIKLLGTLLSDICHEGIPLL